MPNRVHGILHLAGRPLATGETRPGPPRASLGAIAGAFKSAAARRVNKLHATPGAPLWQRTYFEHIIRDTAELAQVRAYIVANPANWAADEFYPLLSAGRTRIP